MSKPCIDTGEGHTFLAFETKDSTTLLPYVDLRRVTLDSPDSKVLTLDFVRLLVTIRGECLDQLIPLFQRQQLAGVRAGNFDNLKIESVEVEEVSAMEDHGG